jgi:hypothetical protein
MLLYGKESNWKQWLVALPKAPCCQHIHDIAGALQVTCRYGDRAGLHNAACHYWPGSSGLAAMPLSHAFCGK